MTMDSLRSTEARRPPATADLGPEDLVTTSRPRTHVQPSELPTMSYNPLAEELAMKGAELEELRGQRSRLNADLDWHSNFDRAGNQESFTKRQMAFDATEATLDEVVSELAARQLRAVSLKANTKAGWDPRYWNSAERRRAMQSLTENCHELTQLEAQKADLDGRLDRGRRGLMAAKHAIAKYDEIDRTATLEAIAALDAEISVRKLEHNSLARRCEHLDLRLEGPVKVLKDLIADASEATCNRNDLAVRVDGLEREMDRAAKLDKSLSGATNGYEKKLIHEKCQSKFGHGSPRWVMNDRRRAVADAKSQIAKGDRRIAAIQRDVRKAEQRVARVVARGTRDIQALVIDGSNLCYQDGTFIGTAALRPLCLHLQGEYVMTVIFDASIRPLLGGLSESSLRARFPDMKVHVVASRTQADETILAAAQGPGVYVLSNDRFSEYRDKSAVRDNRLIRHEILDEQILIHFLEISLPWGQTR